MPLLISLVAFALAVAGCGGGGGSSSETAIIRGQIFEQGSTTPLSVPVTIKFGTKSITTTDGQYVSPLLKPGPVSVTVTGVPGYNDFTAVVTAPRSDPPYDIYLTPAPSGGGTPGGDGGGGGSDGSGDAQDTLAFASSGVGWGVLSLWTVDPEATNTTGTQLYWSGSKMESPSWSPNRTRIAFASSQNSELSDIWVMNADGSNPRPLTHNAWAETGSKWSPTGEYVVFTSYRNGAMHGNLAMVRADGSLQAPTELTNTKEQPYEDISPSWSPEGYIVFASSRASDGYRLYILDMNRPGSAPYQLSGLGASGSDGLGYYDWDPVWSPDGRRLAFASDRTGAWQIYVADIVNDGGILKASSSPIRLTGPNPGGLMNPDFTGRRPSWSPDGDYLAFEDEAWTTLYRIPTDPSEGTKPEVITSGVQVQDPSWSS